jgi:hypothetical protein
LSTSIVPLCSWVEMAQLIEGQARSFTGWFDGEEGLEVPIPPDPTPGPRRP